MSAETSPAQTPAFSWPLASLSPQVQSELERVAAYVATRDDAWNVPRESGVFLHALVLAGGFRRGLEIGTSYGYSGLWLGAALQRNGGTLTTLELNPAKIDYARAAFERAGLAGVVRVLAGDALENLRQLYSHSAAACGAAAVAAVVNCGAAEIALEEAAASAFDFVFIDADKERSLPYFEAIWPMLAERAVLVTDNITSHRDALADFARHLRNHPRLVSTLVPVGSGLELSVRVPEK